MFFSSAMPTIVLLSVFVFERLSRFLNYQKTLNQILTGLGLTLGSVLGKPHLYIFDKLFLKQGSIQQILKRTEQ